MIDLGLVTGIKDLWQENLLRDYTLVVEGRELQVHKVVLAAVSKYFKAMLGEMYLESKKDRVDVKGFSAEIVGKLLKFIYTGEDNIITDDTPEVLRCSMYLQMPLVSQFCVKKLVENLNIKNCVDILYSLITFAFPKEVIEVKDFIHRNWKGVLENCNLETLSSDAVQVLMDCWQTCEWDMFMFLKKWICHDYGNRISYVNDLMSKVRFCLISPDNLEAITEMDIFRKTEDPWQDLVVNAVKYFQLPIHHKVLDRSENSKVRSEPSAAFIVVESSEGIVKFFTSDRSKKWKMKGQKGFDTSVMGEYTESICIEVNNFLVVCRTLGQNQIWQIFDPRTLTWSTIPNMERPKRYFAMVHHKDILYTVGGEYMPDIPSCEMDRYSFLTSKWSSIHVMPVSLNYPAACVLGDTIYVSGGIINHHGSKGMYCLRPSSQTREWYTKASCLWKVACHQMSVLKRSGEEGLFIIDLDLDMQFYSPSNNQWSEITTTVKPYRYDSFWLEDGLVFTRGNSVFILDMYFPVFEDDEPDEDRRVCWKLTIPENGREITKEEMQDCPDISRYDRPDTFGAMLAISPQKVKY